MFAGAASSQEPQENRALTHREQAPIVHRWIEKRFDTLLPGLMRREGIDMWIIVSREYNDDPVFRSMAPLTTYASRRRTILFFFDRGGEQPVERLSIGRFDYEGLYEVPGRSQHIAYLVEPKDSPVGTRQSVHWINRNGVNERGSTELNVDVDGLFFDFTPVGFAVLVKHGIVDPPNTADYTLIDLCRADRRTASAAHPPLHRHPRRDE